MFKYYFFIQNRLAIQAGCKSMWIQKYYKYINALILF